MIFLWRFGKFGLLFMMGALAQNKCPAGWFGTLCNMMCHCNVSPTCGSNGECPKNEQCRKPFFGPGCQHSDAYQIRIYTIYQDYVNDNDDTTCNPNSAATSYEKQFQQKISFTWIRIVGKKSVIGLPVLMSYKYCDDPWLYYINEKTVDYLCGNSFSNTKIGYRFKITGDLPSLICTINISEGRNVAVKQFVNMSSTNKVSGRRTDATQAVDGNNGMDRVKDGCAEFEPFKPREIYLFFPNPVYVHKYYYYGYVPKDLLKLRLLTQGYSDVTSQSPAFSSEFINIFSFGSFFFWEEFDYSTVRYIVFKETYQRAEILSMCEMEFYGEILCPPYKYGLECQFDCTCCKNQFCNPITGACGQYPAEKAEKNPPLHSCPNCQRNCCESSGKCLEGCVAGFSGSYCQDGCIPGHYGPKCTIKCPSTCWNNTCDPKLGYCYGCMEGHVGEFCTLPPPGKDEDKEFDYSYLLSLAALLPVLCCLYCCLFGKKRTKDTTHPEVTGPEEKHLSEEHLSQAGSSVDS